MADEEQSIEMTDKKQPENEEEEEKKTQEQEAPNRELRDDEIEALGRGASFERMEDELRKRSLRQHKPTADSTIGGLLTHEGADTRVIREEEDAEQQRRRTGKWRGHEKAGVAAIKFSFAMETFDYKIKAAQLASDCRVFIAFLVMFCIFFLVDRDVTENHFFTHKWKETIVNSEIAQLKQARYFSTISEAEEWNLYIVQQFFLQTIDLEYVTGADYFVGAVRFRTQRVRKNTCTINNAIIPQSMPPQARECYGPWDADNADDGTMDNEYNKVGRWKYTACDEFTGGQQMTGQLATYDCGGYWFIVPWWRNQTDMSTAEDMPFPSRTYERVSYDDALNLYAEPAFYNSPPFVDNLATRLAIIEYFGYNAALRTFLGVKQFAEVAAGGLWRTDTQFRIFEVWTKTWIAKTVYDAFFFAFVFYYIYDFIHDLLVFRRKENKTLAFFFDTWNLMELLNLIIFIVVLGLRIAWIVRCQQADLHIENLVYDQEYPSVLDDIQQRYMMQVYFNSVNIVFTFLKMLKFLRLNDRLNILTRTLGESQDSIVGVLFIFFLVVTAFAMTGHGLFGLGVWRFRSIDSAFSTMLLMLLGQFDYEEMKNENRVLAGIFFWGYIILALFCLLNFLIGVLMETFKNVSSTKPLLPLDTVLAKTWEEWKRLLSCSNIKRSLSNLVTFNSRPALLEKAHEELTEYRALVYSEDEEGVPDEEYQMLYRTMFIEGVSQETQEKVGKDYFEYVWDDLVYEWDQSKNADEAIEAARNLEMTTKGVRAAIGKSLEQVENFGTRLQELEKELEKIAELLELQSPQS